MMGVRNVLTFLWHRYEISMDLLCRRQFGYVECNTCHGSHPLHLVKFNYFEVPEEQVV
jgi:hypothetical protein